MRISNINPEYLKDEDRVKLFGGEIVPFMKGKVRLATKDELKDSNFQYTTFIPIVWID